MAYTGTLPPKVSRDAAGPRLAPKEEATSSEVKEAEGQGAFPFYLLLGFSFMVLGQPQNVFWKLEPILSPFSAIFSRSALLFWAIGLVTGKIKFRKSKELNLVLALTAWFVLGLPFAYWRSHSLEIMWSEWMKTVVIFVLLTQTVTTRKRVHYLLWLIFISGLMATGGSLLLGHVDLESEQRFMGLTRGFFSGNYLGIAAGVTVPYLSVMLIRSRSILKQLLLIACFASMVFMIVLTASRSNLISIIVSLLLTWVLVLKDSIKAQLIGVCFAVGLVVAVAFAPIAFWERVGTLWGSQASATSTFGDSANESELQRKRQLDLSIVVTAKYPIFGLGIANFAIYSGSTIGVAGAWLGTHNTFTQISSEGGIPALIIYLMLLVTVIVNMRRLAKRCKRRPELAEEKALANATIVSILSFMVGACFAHIAYEYYLYYLAGVGVALQTVFLTTTGQSLAPTARAEQKQNANGFLRFRQSIRGARA